MSRERASRFAVPIAGLALVFCVASRTCRADAGEPPQPATRDWYAGIATGWYFPIQKWSSSYSLGGGGVLMLGHQLSSNLSVRLKVNMWLLSGDRNNTWDLKVTPEIKWDLGSGRLKPLVWLGAGTDYQANYPGPVATITLVIPVGLGLQWDLNPQCRLFIEGSYNLLFKPVRTQDVPVLGGFEVHF